MRKEMTFDEFYSYACDIHNKIFDKLNDEEKNFFSATLDTADELAQKSLKLEQALADIEIILDLAPFDEDNIADNCCEEINQIREIIKKAKGE